MKIDVEVAESSINHALQSAARQRDVLTKDKAISLANSANNQEKHQ